MDDKPIPVLDESDSTAEIDHGYRVGQAELGGACVRLLAQVQARLNTLNIKLRTPAVALAKRYPSPTDSEHLSDKLLGLHFIERRYLGCIEGGYESPFARHDPSLVSSVRS
jgi:hypothetical protein